jgi:hypothetical protein
VNGLKWARAQWDRIAGIAAVGLGAIAIVVGWNRVGSEALTAQQVPYIISGGIGGLFLLGVGATLWLSADLRDEWRKLDAIEEATRSAVPGRVPDSDPFAGPHDVSGVQHEAAAQAGTRRPRRTRPLSP